MCQINDLSFALRYVKPENITGKSILDVGSYEVNGSLRPAFEVFRPKEYIGVDLQSGPGVDVVCNAETLIEAFGKERFDYVLCASMLEHVKDWKTIISNMKGVLKPGGYIFIVAPSHDFSYHEYPYDFWRYEQEDFEEIFSDFIAVHAETNFLYNMTYLHAQKPETFIENDLSRHALYCIVTDKKHVALDEQIEEALLQKSVEHQEANSPKQLRRRGVLKSAIWFIAPPIIITIHRKLKQHTAPKRKSPQQSPRKAGFRNVLWSIAPPIIIIIYRKLRQRITANPHIA